MGLWLGLAAGVATAASLPTLQAAGLAPVDADGDGLASIETGGTDCDDKNPNRFPGNVEICDAAHVDEDCDPTTFGLLDLDRDGFAKAQCCNRTSTSVTCGTDADDGNAAIHPGAMVCDGLDLWVGQADGTFEKASCPTGTVCVSQPNGTGVCGVKPPGYATPGKKTFWKKPAPTGKAKPDPKTMTKPAKKPTTKAGAKLP